MRLLQAENSEEIEKRRDETVGTALTMKNGGKIVNLDLKGVCGPINRKFEPR